jgi:hypothetical protein
VFLVSKHKNGTTLTQLLAFPQNEGYICKAAKTVEQAKTATESEFQMAKLLRKLKPSYLGTQ